MQPDSRPMSHSVGTITTFVMPHMQNVLGDLFGGRADGAGGPGGGGGGDPARRRAGRDGEHRPGGFPGADSGRLAGDAARRPWTSSATPRWTSRSRSTPRRVSTGERRHTHTAHVVFVAIDEHGKPHAGAPAGAGDRRGAGSATRGRRRTGWASGRHERPRVVAVVLSGGGAKTAAHLGAVRALAEAGLAPARYVATSMGAVVAAGLAAGIAHDGAAGAAGGGRAAAGSCGSRWRRWPGCSRARCSGRRRSGARSRRWCPPAASPSSRVPLTVAVADLDTRRAGAVRRGRRRRAAGRRALRHLRAAALLPARDAGRPPLRRRRAPRRAAARGGGRGSPWSRSSRWTSGPGSISPPGAAAARAALVRAHDEAVGIADGGAHRRAQLAAWRADPARPPLTYVRPRVERNATFQVDRMRRYAEDGYQAARAALASRRAHLTPTPFGAN